VVVFCQLCFIKEIDDDDDDDDDDNDADDDDRPELTQLKETGPAECSSGQQLSPISTTRVDGPRKPVTRQLGPSTRVVETERRGRGSIKINMPLVLRVRMELRRGAHLPFPGH